MKTGYKVLDAMTTKPVTALPDTMLQECAKIMAKEHVGALIIRKDGILLGVITEQDVVRKLVAEGINPVNEKVEDYMEKNIETIGPEVDIYEALIKMRDLNIRHLPVVDSGEMVGLLTLKDILKIEPQLFDFLVERFVIKEETRKPIHEVAKEGICQGCGTFSEELIEVSDTLLCKVCAKEQKKV
ncbi:CBS domain-containing protein [Candidatus Woesearchaeota archaeon]|nr:CBS domain-containing protein [Candidatus Woesearchaeota archaeon]